ncbi:MAG: hypothetical protein IMZ47_02275 [Firmicutes bacterium]|nr:hypothetical protein [Bacillota bacterium]
MLDIKKDTLKFPGNYRGKVLDNVDPNQQGKIKVEIFGILDGISADDLPWAVPAHPIFSGAGVGFGYFAVPEINSNVWCFFEHGDVYQPVYFAEAPDGVHGLPTERTTNYPFSKVWKTKSGIIIHIDDSEKEIRVTHPSGTFVEIDATGNITISGEDITVTGGAVVIEGTTVNINPS